MPEAFDWKALVGKVAPAIASTFGTPLMGMGVKALCEFLGLPTDSKEEDISKAMQAMTPDQVVTLKKNDQDFQVKMAEAGIKLEDIAAKDRASSRDRAVAQHDWTPQWIGCFLVVFWCVVNLMILSGYAKPSISPDLMGRILGNIDAAMLGFTVWLYGDTRNKMLASTPKRASDTP